MSKGKRYFPQNQAVRTGCLTEQEMRLLRIIRDSKDPGTLFQIAMEAIAESVCEEKAVRL